jgi:hypothetical protein
LNGCFGLLEMFRSHTVSLTAGRRSIIASRCM